MNANSTLGDDHEPAGNPGGLTALTRIDFDSLNPEDILAIAAEGAGWLMACAVRTMSW